MKPKNVNRPSWSDKYKQNWDEAYLRVMAWWEGSFLDRPVVIAPLAKPGAPAFAPSRRAPDWEQRDLDVQYHLEATRYRLENTLFMAETAAASGTGYASLLWMLGAMAGAKIHYTPETGTAWVDPIPDLYSRPLPEFDNSCPPYAFAVEMIHRYAVEFGYDCILGANPMVDALTTLSMMRGPEQLCLDLIDCPETVRLWQERLVDLFLQIVAGWRDARAVHGRREDINWTGMWAPGDMDAVQCDFAAMLSPAMFKQFAMPELEREAAFFDYALWHLDGPEQICHLDLIMSVPQIKAIQWADNPYAPSLRYVDMFRRIKSAGRSVICSVRSADEAIELTREVGKDGLAICVTGLREQQELEQLLTALKHL